MSGDETPAKITAFYDGKCPMCAAFVGSVAHSARKDEFDLRDMHAESSLPFAKDAIEKEIHVVDAGGRTHKGAAAIMTIVARYPHLRWLARTASFPLILPFLPIGYRLVAANRRFLFGPGGRIFWLKVAVVLAFCLGLAMSSRVWIGPRSYPLTPVFDLFGSLLHLSDTVLFAALFALAAVILVYPKPQKFIAAFVAIVAIFCLLDVTRLQPWVYQYGLVVLTLGLFSWDSDDVTGRQRTLNIVRLIVAATYVFSGLQKINAEFIEQVFPDLVQPISDAVPVSAYPLYLAGFAAPFIQIAFGIGLLTRRFRRVSLIAAVAMHVFILAMLGPFGANWNSIVWPWTAALAAFDLLLFTGKEKFSLRDVLWTRRYPYHAAVLGLLAVAPLLSFFGLWDAYLSAALYSGNLTEAFIYVTEEGKRVLPEDISRHLEETAPGHYELDFGRWSVADLNVTPYPETRVYKRVAKQVCQRMRDSDDLVLVIREQRLFLGKPEAAYRCADL